MRSIKVLLSGLLIILFIPRKSIREIFCFYKLRNALPTEVTLQSRNSSNYWKKTSSSIFQFFKDGKLPLSFTNLPQIAHTMFVNSGGSWMNEQLTFLESNFDHLNLRKLLAESIVGMPLINNFKYLTSHNSIHHLYHLAFFSKITKTEIDTLSSIVEFGGGFGNMAKIARKINPNSTYVILDLYDFCLLQYIYLATVFGFSNVVLISKVKDIQKGKINILLDYERQLSDLSEYSFDLFIATWSLSETTMEIQNKIKKHGFLNAKQLLIAYQNNTVDFEVAERIPHLVKDFNIIYNKPVHYIKNNNYLFAQK